MNLIDLSIKRPVFITMITVFLVVLGALSLTKLPVDLYPTISFPVLAVRTELPGAAPEEMEQLVTKKLEDVLSNLPGLTTLRSASMEGTSYVALEFDQGVDMKFQEIQVRAKVANIRKRLPDNISEPVVVRQDPDDVPILELSLSGERDSYELSDIGENTMAVRLRQVLGVGQVDVVGGYTREILIELDRVAMERWQLTPIDVIGGLQKSNENRPLGQLEGQEYRWTVRSVARIETLEDLKAVPVGKSPDGSPIFLRDVGHVSESFYRPRILSLIGNKKSFNSAVTLQIYKQSGENTVEIADRVFEVLEELKQVLPEDIVTSVVSDNSKLIRSNVKDVYESLVIAGVLTIFVVLLFLRSPRSTLTTGLALPNSVITTFAIMALAGFSINIMTLLALSLSIGLLVDDAIVVRENIFRHLQSGQSSPADAAALGTKEVALAVVATTLTIVAIFLPVAGMSGIIGQFFKPFALTIVFAMLVSLWDAMTMAPMLSAYFANRRETASEWKVFGKWGDQLHSSLEVFEHGFEIVSKIYHKMLSFLLVRNWIAGLIALVAIASAMFALSRVNRGFAPPQLGETFTVVMDGPLAMTLQAGQKIAQDIHERLSRIEALETWNVRLNPNSSGSIQFNIGIKLIEGDNKTQTEFAAKRQIVREALDSIEGFRLRISEAADPLGGGGGGRFQPILVNITGPDHQKILEFARQVRDLLQGIEGVSDVGNVQEDRIPEIQLRYNPLSAAEFGISASQVADNVSVWLNGDTSQALHEGDDQVPIRILMKDANEQPLDWLLQQSLLSKPFGGKKAQLVALSRVVTPIAASGPNIITRENRQRIRRVGASLAPGASLNKVAESVETQLKTLPLDQGYSVKLSGQNQQMKDLFRNIAIALGLGCLFVYMVLASLFESYIHPFTVMTAIPLAATGALLALQWTGLPLDLYGGIGLILLAGIVAKNSILLIDFAMQRVRTQKIPPMEAILESAPLRLRPIVMTSAAMIAGMLPVALGIGASGEARKSLGMATIGGVVSSTLLTLLVVPSLYVVLEKARLRLLSKPMKNES